MMVIPKSITDNTGTWRCKYAGSDEKSIFFFFEFEEFEEFEHDVDLHWQAADIWTPPVGQLVCVCVCVWW